MTKPSRDGWSSIPQTDDPREWLRAVMNSPDIEMEHRIEAAAALASADAGDEDADE